jgi:hypothetical protein
VLVCELIAVARGPLVGKSLEGLEVTPGVPVMVSVVCEGGGKVLVGVAVTGVKEEMKVLLAVL